MARYVIRTASSSLFRAGCDYVRALHIIRATLTLGQIFIDDAPRRALISPKGKSARAVCPNKAISLPPSPYAINRLVDPIVRPRVYIQRKNSIISYRGRDERALFSTQ